MLKKIGNELFVTDRQTGCVPSRTESSNSKGLRQSTEGLLSRIGGMGRRRRRKLQRFLPAHTCLGPSLDFKFPDPPLLSFPSQVCPHRSMSDSSLPKMKKVGSVSDMDDYSIFTSTLNRSGTGSLWKSSPTIIYSLSSAHLSSSFHGYLLLSFHPPIGNSFTTAQESLNRRLEASQKR